MGIFNKLFGNNDKKNSDNYSNLSVGTFDKFIKTYKPSTDLIKPTQKMLDWYADKLPKELLDFWKEYGFGNYGSGLIKVIEPSEYMDSFYKWIGKQDHSKIPILVTGFGDIFYYRKLPEKDEDVSFLDIHYQNIDVCDYSLKHFFEKYIVDPELSKELLRKILFEQAIKKMGNLAYEEIYFFKPALFLGGGEDLKYIDKGKGGVHQLVLQHLRQKASS